LKITRGGRLTGDLTEDVARLTSSAEHDPYISDAVVEINLAHVLSLVKGGCLSNEEGRWLASALNELLGKGLTVPPDMEDIHMVIEEEVTRKVGPDLGGKLHTGKSRNDQVATAVRMRLREFLIEILGEVNSLQATLSRKASGAVELVIPGFTHLQHAQPVTAGHYLLAYFDMFGRDFQRIRECFARVNLSPMGAAALAGTGFRVNRGLAASYLGFDGLVENTMDAVSSRDFAIETVSALSILMTHVSRISEEIVVWSSQEFGYLALPDDHSSTSSIMPQKKNPVTAEVLRAKSADVFGELTAMVGIMKALPLAYNLDMQEVTPHLWRACEVASLSLRVLTDLIDKMKFDEKRLRDAVMRDSSVATELADTLVREGGMTFRRAHQVVGGIVKDLAAAGSSLTQQDPEKLAGMVSAASGKGLPLDSIKAAVDPAMNVNVRSTTGGPSFAEVSRMLAERSRALSSQEAALSGIKIMLGKSRETMQSELSAL
jgi:argininosuccinate lyase